jgi:hypothetical protein
MTNVATTPPASADTVGSSASVVGVYDDIEAAQQAVTRLTEAGFPIDHVSIVGQNLQSETQFNGFVSAGDVAKSSATMGAWVGGLFGLLTGFAALFIPGVGPVLVLGPLAATAIGAAEGAVGAGVLGGILGAFIERKHIPKFSEHLKAGKYLVVVHGSQEQVTRASGVMRETGASDITEGTTPAAAA